MKLLDQMRDVIQKIIISHYDKNAIHKINQKINWECGK